MRLLFAIALGVLALLLVAFLLLVRPAWAGAVRCTTYEQKSLGQWYTVCDAGTKATSYWNKTLERWESTVTETPRQACRGRLHPMTKPVEIRCR